MQPAFRVARRWVRFQHQGRSAFGTLDGDTIRVYRGDMFACPEVTAELLELRDVKLLTPTQPTKMLGLWNNCSTTALNLGLGIPGEPLYFLKGSNASLASGDTIRRPSSYCGRIIFEGELGVVIGKTCYCVAEDDANKYIFGYTCVNDITAIDVIDKYPMFPQWTRAKSCDTFGAFGPVVATELNPDELVVSTVHDGEERQNYPVSRLVFKPARLVSLLSRDMTLMPGDVIACGTSSGSGCLRSGSIVEVFIAGIGTLRNNFQ